MNAAAEPAIRVRGLRTSFGDRIVHDGLDLDVRRGEILGVVGGSGSGKTVLLNTILGLKLPDAGAVTVFGLDGADRAARTEIERRIGVLFQQGALFTALTVQENVEAPFVEYTRLPLPFVGELAALKLRLVGLPESSRDLFPAELSGGMRKRAGIARALALDPELLFLDEPTSGLDPIGAAAFDALVRELRDALGLTVFLITHDLETLYAICDRVAVIADRKVIAIGSIAELETSTHPWIREYFLGPRSRVGAGRRH